MVFGPGQQGAMRSLQIASIGFGFLTWAIQSHASAPDSWSLWSATIVLPSGLSVRKTSRGGDAGYGVDIQIGNASVNASVWDDDGNAFFSLHQGTSYCEVSVGSDGPRPGLVVEVFEQRGLDCQISAGTGGSNHFLLSMATVVSSSRALDCGSSSWQPTEKPCNNSWRAPAAMTKTSTTSAEVDGLWRALIQLPAGMSASKTYRATDPGYGVDLKFGHGDVDASVWDTDGNAYFRLRFGKVFCKISVGSDGPNPGLVVEVFQQHGLECNITSGRGGPVTYKLALAAEASNSSKAYCGSSRQYYPKKPCDIFWRPPKSPTQTKSILV